MKISKEFSNNASSYDEYNSIQQQVAQKLVDSLHVEELSNIIDLGCGSGAIYNLIGSRCENFYAIDFAQGMLDKHVKADNLSLALADFNEEAIFKTFQNKKIDRLISSSSLQWALDLDTTFSYISSLKTKVALAIFTCNTFKTIHEYANISKLLRCADEVEQCAKKYFDAKYELVSYKLHFDNNQEMFRYIKKSGVSGSRNMLGYKETKALIRNYPLSYLEFEVLFIIEE